MNQLLTKRTLSLGRINLFLKYKIRLKNALASNIELMNVDSTKLPADDKRNAAFETMRMSPALQQHIIEQNDPTAGKDGMNDQGFFFRYFFPLYALLLYIIMCAWDELQKLDFLHPEMYRGRTFAYYRDISYRRAVWFYERHMGYETTEKEDDLFPRKTDHPLLNRQRAYHQQKLEERENEKREKYESEMRAQMRRIKDTQNAKKVEVEDA